MIELVHDVKSSLFLSCQKSSWIQDFTSDPQRDATERERDRDRDREYSKRSRIRLCKKKLSSSNLYTITKAFYSSSLLRNRPGSEI
jgi:hypothetical protein